MDGDLFRRVSIVSRCRLPGAAFGEEKLPPRPLDPGMEVSGGGSLSSR